jgi:putative cell wall-binding protein
MLSVLLRARLVLGALVVASVAAVVPAAPAAAATPIMSQSRATAEQMASWYTATGKKASLPLPIEDLARLFLEEGAAEGVRGDIAFAQSILETGYFTFPSGGQVRSSHNNYGGLGAVDGGSSPNRFPSPRIGVRAQIQHLRAYADRTVTASNLAHPLVSPRFHLVAPKGKAPAWENLGRGNWATDPSYASKILSIYGRIMAHPVPPAPACKPTTARQLARASGMDRVSTAAAVSRHLWCRSETVLVASADRFPDALSGTPLAADRDAPLLLVGRHRLPVTVAHEIVRLRARRVVVLGGTGAVSEQVARQLRGLPTGPAVQRIAGVNRFATAANVAAGLAGPAPTVALASSRSFADAVAAGGLSEGKRAVPVLLTEPHGLPPETRDALLELRPETLLVVGGATAISERVVAELADVTGDVRRVDGRDRYATAGAAALLAGSAMPTAPAGLVVATGAAFPDALAAAAGANRIGGLVALTPPHRLTQDIGAIVGSYRSSLGSNLVVGGHAAVQPGTAKALADLLAVPPPR